MRFGWMAAVAASLIATTAPAAVINVAEVEPNDSIEQAQFLPVTLADSVRVTGDLESADLSYVDFFRFTIDAPACDARETRCYQITVASIGPGGTAAPALTLFAPDGTDLYPSTSNSVFQYYTSQTGPWTIGVRRAAADAPSGYVMVASYALAVPELATWAMMIAGVWLIGGALRVRRGSLREVHGRDAVDVV